MNSTMLHAIHNCVVDMSSLPGCYQGQMYASEPDAKLAGQTAMYIILDTLTRLLAPVLAFTAEEIWQYLPHTDKDNAESIMLNDWPESKAEYEDEALAQKWDRILEVRDGVLKALEEARNQKLIGQSLQAKLVIKAKGERFELLKENLEILPTVFITSQVELKETDGEELEVEVLEADGEKCERCWIYSTTVGHHHDKPTLCERCSKVV